MKDPLSRIVTVKEYTPNIFQLVGQFLWTYRGSFNTKEITYYAPSSDRHSSDGSRMIGAYGPRLFGIQHMNQIQHAINVLSTDHNKRRAVASVYLPQFDQHQLADEVPCTLNLQYLIRDKKLHAITYMRSQNAFRLFPYDVFLFTMLQEYVKAVLESKLELELGNYYHFCGSCHFYENDRELVDKVLKDRTNSCCMCPMPSDDIDLALGKVNELEAFVRTTVMSSPKVDFSQFLEKVDRFDDEYWKQIGWILICYATLRANNLDCYKEVFRKINSIYKTPIEMYKNSNLMQSSQN